MKQVKIINGVLWTLNVLAGAAIVVFAFQYLLFPEQENLLEKVVEDAPGSGARKTQQPPTDYSVLRNLVNPVIPRKPGQDVAQGPNELERVAKFLGGYRIADREESEVAFLLIPGVSMNVNAYRGQPISTRSSVVVELRGWTLVRLTEDGAIFTNGQREVELRRDDAAAASAAAPTTGRGGPATPGRPFDLSQSKSRKTASTDAHESWLVDAAEIQWANQSMEQLMADVQLSAYPSGGVKIDAAGSFAQSRGFYDNDVIKTVNGMSVRDRTDLINLTNNPQMKNAGAVVVVVERAGKPYTLDFRPDRGQPPR